MESSQKDGLYIGVACEGGGKERSADQMLIYGVWATTNAPESVYVLVKADYAYKVSLTNAKGAIVKKTPAGEKVGSGFLTYTATFAVEGPKLQRLVADKKGEPVQLNPLFRPNELFEILEPGEYNLKFELQVVTRKRIGTNEIARLVRFPEIDLPIVKR